MTAISRVLRSSLPGGLALLFMAPSATAADQVFTIDDDGGADFTGLAAAVAAAGDGDILIVKGGTYFDVTIDDKSLVLIGEPAGAETPDLLGLTIRNLSSTKRVVIRGLRLDGFLGHPAAARVEKNDGPVIFEGCTFENSFSTTSLAVEESDSVFVIRSVLRGLDGTPSVFASSFAYSAVSSLSSRLFIHDSLIEGGDGAAANLGPFGDIRKGLGGAPAIEVIGGTLFVSGGTTRGGDGGANLEILGTCAGAGFGAPAIRLTGNALLRRLDALLVGGVGGAANGSCPGGASGPEVEILAGRVETIAETARSIEVSGLVREGQSATVTLQGASGDLVAVLYGFQDAGLYVPGLQGGLLVGLPPLITVLGPIPATGLSVAVTIPANQIQLPVEGFTLFVQPLVAGTSGLGVLGAPSVLTIIDSTL